MRKNEHSFQSSKKKNEIKKVREWHFSSNFFHAFMVCLVKLTETNSNGYAEWSNLTKTDLFSTSNAFGISCGGWLVVQRISLLPKWNHSCFSGAAHFSASWHFSFALCTKTQHKPKRIVFVMLGQCNAAICMSIKLRGIYFFFDKKCQRNTSVERMWHRILWNALLWASPQFFFYFFFCFYSLAFEPFNVLWNYRWNEWRYALQKKRNVQNSAKFLMVILSDAKPILFWQSS